MARAPSKETEAFYKAETFRRVAEAPAERGASAVELLREEERIKNIKRREGLKMAGITNLGIGVSLIIFLRALIGADVPVYLWLAPALHRRSHDRLRLRDGAAHRVDEQHMNRRPAFKHLIAV